VVDRIGDPFLNYFALGLLIFVVVAVFYGIIAIHDIPARIAKSRHHPHEDAIHAAGWVSLFTLHVLWPFLWIWAMAYQPERGWGFSGTHAAPPISPSDNELDDLRRRISELENNRVGRFLDGAAELKAETPAHRQGNTVERVTAQARAGD
jgi:Protein of unknown function (DUF3302)